MEVNKQLHSIVISLKAIPKTSILKDSKELNHNFRKTKDYLMQKLT